MPSQTHNSLHRTMFATPRTTVNPPPIRTTPSGVILWPVNEIRAGATVDSRVLADYLQELESEITQWHKRFIHVANEAAQLRVQFAQGNWVPIENLRSWDETVHARDTEFWKLGGTLRALEQQIAQQRQYIGRLEQACRTPQVSTTAVENVSDSASDRNSSRGSQNTQSDK